MSNQRVLVLSLLLLDSCGSDDDSASQTDASPTAQDMGHSTNKDSGPESDAQEGTLEIVCDPDEEVGVIQVGTMPDCPRAPEFIGLEITDSGHRFDVFTYEASHPLANEAEAFPCVDESDTETTYRAPEEAANACSRAGVRPWHSIRWGEADAACGAIGWRLCTGQELLMACGGSQRLRFSYGAAFEDGKCNVQGSWRAEGSDTVSEAPTGRFEECVSPDGIFDADGNLWEWTSDTNPEDDRNRYYQGAGWRIIPERHDDENQSCTETTETQSISARTFSGRDVGFRCCRDAP